MIRQEAEWHYSDLFEFTE